MYDSSKSKSISVTLSQEDNAPTGNRTQGKCLEGIYVTTTPSALALLYGLSCIYEVQVKTRLKTVLTPPPPNFSLSTSTEGVLSRYPYRYHIAVLTLVIDHVGF